MYGEIITIGNELTSGRTRDLNAWYAAGRLTASGLKVLRITAVGDDKIKVTEALSAAIGSSRFVIVTGGLGSTEDDMTSSIAAQALDRPLCLDEGLFAAIKAYVESKGIVMTPSLEKMAWMPEGSRLISPKAGVCGFTLTEKGVSLYFLPGVPEQMRYLMDEFVIPEILTQYKDLPTVRHKTIKLLGINEPAIAEAFKKLRHLSEDALFGFYPQHPENHITISLRGSDAPLVDSKMDSIRREVKDLFGPFAFGEDSQELEDVVGGELAKRDLTIAVAESCTGGMIGERITRVSGSSSYFLGGVIAYSNEAKVRLLGVDKEVLSSLGAVSDAAARQMAEGVRRAMNSDLGLSVTGIAGPTGGSEAKPVGTVHIGVSSALDTTSRAYRFRGNRQQVRAAAAAIALDSIRRYVCGYPLLSGL